jgi:putative flippase GtrA
MKITLQIFWFGVAGILGFVTDTVVLYILKDFFGLYVARLVSFLFAVNVTWLFNRFATFRTRRSNRPAMMELLIYFCLMLIGGIANYSVYAVLVYKNAQVSMYPVLGVAVGSLAGMSVNFILSRSVLFKFPCG